MKVDSKNPDRGPLLIISGENDNTVPWAIANASYKKQTRNEGVTEIVEMADRGTRSRRQRLARGRRHRARIHPALRLSRTLISARYRFVRVAASEPGPRFGSLAQGLS